MTSPSLPFGAGAVMASRASDLDSLDYFPTPPWATRAAVPYLREIGSAAAVSVEDPACGEGHMAAVLAEAFPRVLAADIHPYGFGTVADYLTAAPPAQVVDLMATNPPFVHARAFVERALSYAQHGAAVLVRTAWLEGGKRYRELFGPRTPRLIVQYAERVPMIERRWDPTATTATSYAWVMWDQNWDRPRPEFDWIAPGQCEGLTLASDYERFAPPRAAWGADRYDPARPPKVPVSWWRFPVRGEGCGWIGLPGEPGWRDDFTHWAPVQTGVLL